MPLLAPRTQLVTNEAYAAVMVYRDYLKLLLQVTLLHFEPTLAFSSILDC